MTLILSGTNGLSDVDGSASTPAIRGTDSNTGIFFPAADTIAFAEGGAEVARFDSSGNLGIGTSSPTARLDSRSNSGAQISWGGTGAYDSAYGSLTWGIGFATIQANTGNALVFSTNGNNERARITSGGTMLIGRTADVSSTTRLGLDATASIAGFVSETGPTTSVTHGRFINGNGTVGSISTNGTATTYSTSSDYRLKEQIQPMVGALAKVAELKPVTYKWKTDGSDGEGFIAHELAEVVPQCVTGEKDAVDEDGNPVYQGIDTSFLVATLTAAIQEQQALIESLTARIAALEAA